VIFSRDELKQHENAGSPGFHIPACVISLVMVRMSIVLKSDGRITIVIHAAALKHAGVRVKNPLNGRSSHINGRSHVIDAAIVPSATDYRAQYLYAVIHQFLYALLPAVRRKNVRQATPTDRGADYRASVCARYWNGVAAGQA